MCPPEARIAVFDNDGTLWVEQPDYAQAAFLFGRNRAVAPEHLERRHQQPFAAVLSGDKRAWPRLVKAASSRRHMPA